MRSSRRARAIAAARRSSAGSTGATSSSNRGSGAKGSGVKGWFRRGGGAGSGSGSTIGAKRGCAAARAGDVAPSRMPVERVARLVERDVLRQLHRQALARGRHHAAGVAMDDRDGAAPVALARDAPVAQAVVHLARRHRGAADRLGLEPRGHRLLRLGDGEAVEEAGIDQPPLADIGLVVDREGREIRVRRADDRRRAEPVLVREVEVALVVTRAAEDRAGAVVHQDEVRDVDRQRPGRIERMHRADAGVVAELLSSLDRFRRGADPPALLGEGGELRVPRGGRLGEWMIRRERHELRAEQRVRPRGEDLELGRAFGRRLRVEREAYHQPLGAADPVALHQPHLVRPAVEPVERLQQVLRIVGDSQEPLRQLALLDERA